GGEGARRQPAPPRGERRATPPGVGGRIVDLHVVVLLTHERGAPAQRPHPALEGDGGEVIARGGHRAGAGPAVGGRIVQFVSVGGAVRGAPDRVDAAVEHRDGQRA